MIFGWNKGIMEIVRKSLKGGEVILYGAGFWGKISFEIFQKVGARLAAFADDDAAKWGTMYCGLPVHSLKECKELYTSAVYVICVDEGEMGKENQRKQRYAMKAKLDDLALWDVDTEIHMHYYTFLLEVNPLENIPEITTTSNSGYNVEDINNLIVFNHMGESGAVYFEQLLDGHPNIIIVPSMMSMEPVYENRLKNLKGTELIIEIMAQMNGFFHGSLEDMTYAQRFVYGYMHHDGSPLSDVVLIHADLYLAQLIKLFDGDFRLKSYGHLLKVLSAAYVNCIGKKKVPGQDSWFFCHMHTYVSDFEGLTRRFSKDFEKIVHLYLVREPVRRLYGFLNRCLFTEKVNKDTFRREALRKILLVGSGCFLKMTEGNANVKVIRFEDLKLQSKETMAMLCDVLGIPYNNSLEETTVNGALAYFTYYDEQGKQHFITGNDASSVKPRPMDNLFSLWDIVRLELVFSKFKQAYGYDVDVVDFDTLSESARKEIFQAEFRFAPVIQQHMDAGTYEIEDEFHYDADKVIRQTLEAFMTENQGKVELYPCISPKFIS